MRKTIFVILAVLLLLALGFIFNKKDTLSTGAEQYYRQTQVNPLFAWPGVDLDDMIVAIETLKKSRSEITRLTGRQYNRDVTDRVQRVLYPTEYLSEMVKLEALRRDLTDNVALADLENYQTQLSSTIKSYEAYLDELIPALKKTAIEQDYKGLQYHFGKSSFKHFISVIRRYRNDVENVSQQASERWECVTEIRVDCVAPHWTPATSIPSVALDPKIFKSANAQIVSSIRMDSALNGKSVAPNWAMTSSHKCFLKHSEVYYFLWELDLGEGVSVWKADAINDVLVHDHQITDDTTNEYERQIDKLGAQGYVYQPYTTQYACPDLAADTGLLRSMSFVYQVLKNYNWAELNDATFTQSAQYIKLQNTAKRITNLAYLSEPLIQEFVHDLSVFLNENDDDVLRATFGETQQDTFEEIILTYTNRTAYLSRDIMALVYANTAIGDYVHYAGWGFVDELLFVRNAPALLLGGFNPSIINNGYSHVERHRKETSPRLQSYNEQLSKQFTQEEFTQILIDGTNAEHSLSQLQDRSYFIHD